MKAHNYILKLNRLLPDRLLDKKLKNGKSEDIETVVSFFKAQEPMDSEKLTGLCYYAYIWGLVILKKEIAPFKFIKTSDGLVEENIYTSNNNASQSLIPRLTDIQRKFLSAVYHQYNRFTGKELEDKIRNHEPYINAHGVLSKNSIYRFYSQFA